MTFTPIDSQPVQSDIMVEFIPGGKAYIGVTGRGQNADVTISASHLHMDSSFISLQSHNTLKIKNASSESVVFTWRSYRNIGDEENEKQKLLHEINRMELEEKDTMTNADTLKTNYTVLSSQKGDRSGERDVGEEEEKGDQYIASGGGREMTNERIRESDGEGEGEGEKEIDRDRDRDRVIDEEQVDLTTFYPKVEDPSFIRKYRNLRYALQSDGMEFIDDIFDISPVSGTIYPDSEIEIAVIFRPDVAGDYRCLAYLDVSGREDRLPLHLTGSGIGPNACLSFDTLDIGDVFISLRQNYDITITNNGDITAAWSFVPSNTRFGARFIFSPEDGILHPNEKCTISILFESDILGEFSEYFRFSLHGNEDMLSCQIKGHVIGPTFHFNKQILDFGSVSYDYLHTQSTQITNTSAISITYNLHIPQDGMHGRKEFNITPHKGTILSGK